jgi:hypothetical protein
MHGKGLASGFKRSTDGSPNAPLVDWGSGNAAFTMSCGSCEAMVYNAFVHTSLSAHAIFPYAFRYQVSAVTQVDPSTTSCLRKGYRCVFARRTLPWELAACRLAQGPYAGRTGDFLGGPWAKVGQPGEAVRSQGSSTWGLRAIFLSLTRVARECA